MEVEFTILFSIFTVLLPFWKDAISSLGYEDARTGQFEFFFQCIAVHQSTRRNGSNLRVQMSQHQFHHPKTLK